MVEAVVVHAGRDDEAHRLRLPLAWERPEPVGRSGARRRLVAAGDDAPRDFLSGRKPVDRLLHDEVALGQGPLPGRAPGRVEALSSRDLEPRDAGRVGDVALGPGLGGDEPRLQDGRGRGDLAREVDPDASGLVARTAGQTRDEEEQCERRAAGPREELLQRCLRKQVLTSST